MKRVGMLIAISVFLLVVLAMADDAPERKIVINEVCSRNVYSYADNWGGYYDWIELYNTSDKKVALKGCKLTDTREKKGKSDEVFKDVVIDAHGYLVVYLTRGERRNGNGSVYADFQISKNGETVYLIGPDKRIIDEVEVPPLDINIAYAREADGSMQWQEKEPTPGGSNNKAEKYLKPGDINKNSPIFSVRSGFYDEAFEVSIEGAGEGEIYYTLDGSVPNKHAISYSGPIKVEDASRQDNIYSMRTDTSAVFQSDDEWALPEELVDKATVIRAISYDADGYPSNIVTATYFVGLKDKEEYRDISVVSLVTDPYNLFDYDHGIYVLGRTYDTSKSNSEIESWEWKRANYRNGKKESEREVHIDFFGEDKNLQFSKECGMRIKGGVSRAYLQKSFNLYARSEYDGTNDFEYNFFNKDMEYGSVTLFAGGNDEVSKMKDYLANSIAEELHFSTMDFRPCAVFLNGEYWGFYYLTEKYDAKYVSEHYGIDEDKVALIKNWTVEEGTEEDLDEFLSDMEYIKTADMTIPENYEEACKRMDMDSLVDYFAFQLYIARCGDWMNGGGGNFACWKSKEISSAEYKDGKWRWMLFDVNSYAMEESGWNTIWFINEKEDFQFLKNLLTNVEFKQKFLHRLNEVKEQLFVPDRIVPVIEEIAAQNKPAVLQTYNRFHDGIFTENSYEQAIQEIVNFYRERYDYVGTVDWSELGQSN